MSAFPSLQSYKVGVGKDRFGSNCDLRHRLALRLECDGEPTFSTELRQAGEGLLVRRPQRAQPLPVALVDVLQNLGERRKVGWARLSAHLRPVLRRDQARRQLDPEALGQLPGAGIELGVAQLLHAVVQVDRLPITILLRLQL